MERRTKAKNEVARRLRRRFTDSGAEILPSEGGAADDRNFHQLPDWFLIELLCRLPIKIVFRFKCVSKQCLSLISNPSFPGFYLSRRFQPPHFRQFFLIPTVRFVEDPKQFFTLTTEPPLEVSVLASLTLPAPIWTTPAEERLEVRAADKGFILIGKQSPVKFGICNPMTKQWFALPPHKFFNNNNVGFIARVESGILASYKVVIINSRHQGFIELQIFSSETRKWADLKVQSQTRVSVSRLKRPVLLKTTLHWVDSRLGAIIAYDPYLNPDSFRIIKLPFKKKKEGQFITYDRLPPSFGVSGGRLKYFEAIEGGLKIWLLQDDDYKWCLHHTSRTEEIIAPESFRSDMVNSVAILVSFHPFDPDVVYLHLDKTGMVSYNMQSRKMEKHGDGGRSIRCFFMELPIWPVPIPASLCIPGRDDDRYEYHDRALQHFRFMLV